MPRRAIITGIFLMFGLFGAVVLKDRHSDTHAVSDAKPAKTRAARRYHDQSAKHRDANTAHASGGALSAWAAAMNDADLKAAAIDLLGQLDMDSAD